MKIKQDVVVDAEAVANALIDQPMEMARLLHRLWVVVGADRRRIYGLAVGANCTESAAKNIATLLRSLADGIEEGAL